MNAVIRFLAGFCRDHPLDEKILVVPSFVAGRQIGEALARQAGSWINLRFVTTPALAAEVLERRGEPSSARPMTSSAEIALTDRLFRELLAEGRLDYFEEAGASPGLSRALHRAIRELRLDGRTSADLRPERFLVARKGAALALLLARYERALDDEGLLDLPGLLARAAEAARRSPLASARILCPADMRLCRIEADLVDAAGGRGLVAVPGDAVIGLDRPRQCRPAPGPPDLASAGRLSWLFAPDQAPPEKEAQIEIFRALGPANECREIVRRLYAEKFPFDQAEILAPPGSAHSTIFYLLAARTGLPVTFGDGVAISFTSPGRLFFGLINWLENDFSSDNLCGLLENGDLTLPAGAGEGPLAPRTACRHLRNAMIGWGRDRYADRLAALRESELAKLAMLEAHAEGEGGGETELDRAAVLSAVAEIEFLSTAVGRILEAVPGPDAAGVHDLRGLCEALFGLVRDLGRAESDFDRRARQALLDRLGEFVAESRFPAMPLKEALDLVRTAGASLRVGASPPLPGRLHVAGLSSGGISGRPLTFVAGLDEASFPGGGLQDPILLDEERAAISDSLPTSADVLRSSLFGLASVLASLRGRLVLSYPSYDIVEGRESFRSSVVLQAFRLLRKDPSLDYAALDKAMAEAAGFLPGGAGRAFDEADWWLDRLMTNPRPDGPRSVAANVPDLAAGLAALEARAGDELTPFDGLVDIGPLRAGIDPFAGAGAVMSATRLELLAKCPFGYFLRHVLKVQPPEEVAFVRSRWLDPLQRGSLVHEILCDFMTEVADKGEEVEAARHGPIMARIAGGKIAAMRRKIPPPSEGIFESERRDILETLDIFLAAEETREKKGRPLAFEKEIGGERIGIADGRSFRLRGFIDRVDEIGPDIYRVIDYKTGSSTPYEDLVFFGRGRTLQPALYAVAFEQIMARERPGSSPRVAESGYFFPSRRGEGHEIMVGDFSRDRLKRLLGELLGLIEKGYFIAGPDAKCDYCDYRPVCLSGRPGGDKEDHEANRKVFEAYRKLDEYK
jgi:RecB family exonuclease